MYQFCASANQSVQLCPEVKLRFWNFVQTLMRRNILQIQWCQSFCTKFYCRWCQSFIQNRLKYQFLYNKVEYWTLAQAKAHILHLKDWTLETLGDPCRPLATWLKMANFPQNGHFQACRKRPKCITGTDFSAPNHHGGPQQWSRWVRTKSIILKPFSDMMCTI